MTGWYAWLRQRIGLGPSRQRSKADDQDDNTKSEEKKYGPYELFMVDEHGRATDAAIQDIILAEGDDEGAMEDTRERARRRGWSAEMIERHYGKPRPKEAE